MKYDAFWISPDGKEYGVEDKHILFMIANPTLFNINRAHTEKLYADFNEKLGFEGKARAQLMIQAMNKGWIRLRHRYDEGWIVETVNYDNKKRQRLTRLMQRLLKEKEIKLNMELHIIDVNTENTLHTTIEKLLNSIIKGSKMDIRDEISNLNAARKGSLFESFYKYEIEPNCTYIRDKGVGADIEINGEYYDLKIWKTKPGISKTNRIWCDYFKANGETFNIWLISEKVTDIMFTIPKCKLEDFFINIWLPERKKKNISSEKTLISQRNIVKERAKEYFQEIYGGKIRIMARSKDTVYGAKSVRPEIISDNPKNITKYDKTILLVGDNCWTDIPEYWVIDHKEDIPKLSKLLEDDGLNRNKKRIDAKSFPSELKFTANTAVHYLNFLEHIFN